MKNSVQFILIMLLTHILQLTLGNFINTNILPLFPIIAFIYCSLYQTLKNSVLFLTGILTDLLFGNLIGQHALFFLLLNQFFSSYQGQKIAYLNTLFQFISILIIMLIYWVSIVWPMYFYQPFAYQQSFWVVFTTSFIWLIVKKIFKN